MEGEGRPKRRKSISSPKSVMEAKVSPASLTPGRYVKVLFPEIYFSFLSIQV